jgi:uncharacterized repeat protein (TIGR03803 family)
MKYYGTPPRRTTAGSWSRKSAQAVRLRISLFVCLILIGLWLGPGLDAQTLKTLHSFDPNQDGYLSYSPLSLSDNVLYGTTHFGAVPGDGTVFRINADGTEFSTIYSFTSSAADGGGAFPAGPLTISAGVIFGTASGSPSGTVFGIKTNGSAQSVLHIFSGAVDGDEPFGGVILSGDTLFGTTSSGTVFKVNTYGIDFVMLYCVACDPDIGGPDTTIYGGLALVGDSLYGATLGGGSYNAGTLFKLGTNGSGFKVLHVFQNTDGAGPWSGLLFHNNRLYGTTTRGGGNGAVGVVFAMNPDGTGFTNLHSFVGNEGAWLQGGLVCSGNTLYGTTMQGGGVGKSGTVFSLKTDGSDFQTLHVFSADANGGAPAAGLTIQGNNLFGTTTTGGDFNNGTVFRISLPAPIPANFVRASNSMVISWPTNSSGLTLQSSADLNAWDPVSTSPVMTNGQYVVTNNFAAPYRFFRLSR